VVLGESKKKEDLPGEKWISWDRSTDGMCESWFVAIQASKLSSHKSKAGSRVCWFRITNRNWASALAWRQSSNDSICSNSSDVNGCGVWVDASVRGMTENLSNLRQSS